VSQTESETEQRTTKTTVPLQFQLNALLQQQYLFKCKNNDFTGVQYYNVSQKRDSHKLEYLVQL